MDGFGGIRQVAPVCTPPNTCLLGPTRVPIPNDISIGSAVLGLITVLRTMRPIFTDRAA